MVLAGDVAFSGGEVQGWDVVRSVSVLELDGPGTGGQCQELMTQTDTKDWQLRCLHQLAKVVDGVLAMGWVTWAVGDEDAIKVVSNFVNRIVKGETSDTCTTADQAAKNVFLDATIDDGDMGNRRGSTDVEWSLCADFSNQVDLFGVDKGFVLVLVVFFSDGDTGQARALLTEMGDNGTSVDTGDCGDTFSSTPLAETFDGGPVGVFMCDVGNDNTNSLDVGALEIFQQAMLITGARRDTVVANEGLGEDEDLTTIGRIGQRLGISDQGGGEDGFARDVAASTEGSPVEDWAISNGEGGTFVGGWGGLELLVQRQLLLSRSVV